MQKKNLILQRIENGTRLYGKAGKAGYMEIILKKDKPAVYLNDRNCGF